MDLEFIRGTRILNYVTSILLCYFAMLPPQNITLPPGECQDMLLTMVGVQFKALIEMGVAIDEQRLARYFSSGGPDLRYTTGLLNRTDLQKRIFVTMEGSYEHPQEIVIIHANGLRVIKVIHLIGRAKSPSHQERMDKKFVHGLTPGPRQYSSRVKMIETLKEMIQRSNPVEIVYWDEKLTNIIPTNQDKMVKIVKPTWSLRSPLFTSSCVVI